MIYKCAILVMFKYATSSQVYSSVLMQISSLQIQIKYDGITSNTHKDFHQLILKVSKYKMFNLKEW